MHEIRAELREDIMEIAQLLRGLQDKVTRYHSQVDDSDDRWRLKLLGAEVAVAASAFDKVAI